MIKENSLSVGGMGSEDNLKEFSRIVALTAGTENNLYRNNNTSEMY